MEIRDAARKTILKHAEVFAPGHFPNSSYPSNEPTWLVMITTKAGTLPSKTSFFPFDSEDSARDFVDQFPPGADITDKLDMRRHSAYMRTRIENLMDTDAAGDWLNIGDSDGALPWQVLKDAGINNGLVTSPHVLEFLGPKRVSRIKKKFGENWATAAEFEYCYLELPHSSPAYLAALYDFHYYITGNDFSAGYILRDLECLVYGVESGAVKADAIMAAAKAGGEARAMAAVASREAILDEMSRLIAQGKKPAQAADIAARRGIGKSGDANRKAWYRHNSGT
ncbi:hypothetical protein [Paracoccus sp. KR1-242]|uniref:hypothetical protein n=1 Tax=Paracoccus sp. KR1-242 TaxID=3410028 RepID=UPI003C0E8E0D